MFSFLKAAHAAAFAGASSDRGDGRGAVLGADRGAEYHIDARRGDDEAARTVEQIGHHGAVALFEDMQREHLMWEQEYSRQGEHRHRAVGRVGRLMYEIHALVVWCQVGHETRAIFTQQSCHQL